MIDERQPKPPTGSFALFFRDRRLTGDFKGISAGDSSRLIAEEWKALSEGEKKVRTDRNSEWKHTNKCAEIRG